MFLADERIPKNQQPMIDIVILSMSSSDIFHGRLILLNICIFFVAILVASWNKICKAHECVQLNVSSLLPGFAVEE